MQNMGMSKHALLHVGVYQLCHNHRRIKDLSHRHHVINGYSVIVLMDPSNAQMQSSFLSLSRDCHVCIYSCSTWPTTFQVFFQLDRRIF